MGLCTKLRILFVGVCLSRTTVQRGAKIKSHAWVQSSIVGWKSTVGKWVSVSLRIISVHVVAYTIKPTL